MPELNNHDDIGYTERLQKSALWKRLLGAQVPYHIHIRRIATGRVLDVGCGTGRNLAQLSPESVGVDTNPFSVQVATEAGLHAQTADRFEAEAATFDTLLFAHVLEHMTNEEAIALVARYIPYLRQGGRVVIIVPQAAGFASDPTHVEPVDHALLSRIAIANALLVERIYSYPFPGAIGSFFKYNETVALMKKDQG